MVLVKENVLGNFLLDLKWFMIDENMNISFPKKTIGVHVWDKL